MRVNLGVVLPEQEGERAWQTDTLHNPSRGENIRPRWGVQRAYGWMIQYDCFDKVRVKSWSWSCVCWQDLSLFALLLLFASRLVYFEPGCVVIAIGAVESKISRFVSARGHGDLAQWLGVGVDSVELVEPLSPPIRYDTVLNHDSRLTTHDSRASIYDSVLCFSALV
jgi:hypothetical protein